MDGLMIVVDPLLRLIQAVLSIYVWVLIASVVLSWLVAFNVINTRNRAIYLIGDVIYRLTEPALRPIRRVLPNLGGIDLSPLVLLLGIYFLQRVIANLHYSLLTGGV
jgi:YggT family protein